MAVPSMSIRVSFFSNCNAFSRAGVTWFFIALIDLHNIFQHKIQRSKPSRTLAVLKILNECTSIFMLRQLIYHSQKRGRYIHSSIHILARLQEIEHQGLQEQYPRFEYLNQMHRVKEKQRGICNLLIQLFNVFIVDGKG